MNFTGEEHEAYEDHLKWLSIETNSLKKGLEKGRQEGEKNKSLEIERKMLKHKRPIEEIIEDTGLTEKEVKTLNDRHETEIFLHL